MGTIKCAPVLILSSGAGIGKDPSECNYRIGNYPVCPFTLHLPRDLGMPFEVSSVAVYPGDNVRLNIYFSVEAAAENCGPYGLNAASFSRGFTVFAGFKIDRTDSSGRYVARFNLRPALHSFSYLYQ